MFLIQSTSYLYGSSRTAPGNIPPADSSHLLFVWIQHRWPSLYILLHGNNSSFLRWPTPVDEREEERSGKVEKSHMSWVRRISWESPCLEREILSISSSFSPPPLYQSMLSRTLDFRFLSSRGRYQSREERARFTNYRGNLYICMYIYIYIFFEQMKLGELHSILFVNSYKHLTPWRQSITFTNTSIKEGKPLTSTWIPILSPLDDVCVYVCVYVCVQIYVSCSFLKFA